MLPDDNYRNDICVFLTIILLASPSKIIFYIIKFWGKDFFIFKQARLYQMAKNRTCFDLQCLVAFRIQRICTSETDATRKAHEFPSWQ